MLSQTRRKGRPTGPLAPRQCLCCSRPAKIRGLCATDYQAARRLVLLQESTWEALEAAGLALPSRRGQGDGPNAFMAKWAALTDGRRRAPRKRTGSAPASPRRSLAPDPTLQPVPPPETPLTTEPSQTPGEQPLTTDH